MGTVTRNSNKPIKPRNKQISLFDIGILFLKFCMKPNLKNVICQPQQQRLFTNYRDSWSLVKTIAQKRKPLCLTRIPITGISNHPILGTNFTRPSMATAGTLRDNPAHYKTRYAGLCPRRASISAVIPHDDWNPNIQYPRLLSRSSSEVWFAGLVAANAVFPISTFLY